MAVDVTGSRLDDRPPAAARLVAAVRRILGASPLCAISTTSRDGRAHVNTAYFAWTDDLGLTFLSHPSSLHCRNLRSRPSMAIAVFESKQQWGGRDRGLQLFGTCRETRGGASAAAEEVYGRRFKAYWDWKADSPEEVSELRFYQFTTRRLKLFDERSFPRTPWTTMSVARGPHGSRPGRG